MATEISQNTMHITPWATHWQVKSVRSQKDVMLAASWGHMGPKRESQIDMLGIRFCQILLLLLLLLLFFLHSISEAVYDVLNSVFGGQVAYICLTFLDSLEPFFLTTL